MRYKQGLLLLTLGACLAAYFAFDLARWFSLDYLKEQQASIAAWRQAQPLTAALCFFLTYVVVTGLSLPGATVMSLAVGAVFGLFWGVILVSFASSIGATLAFLSARFLLRDWVQRHFGARLATLNAGIEKDGSYYLFSLRLIPVFPFFIINLLMGLTPMRTGSYYIATQTGMLAANVVFINAGTQLAKINALADILSPGILGAFILLGLLPLLVRRMLNAKAIRQGFRQLDAKATPAPGTPPGNRRSPPAER
jgi:uncharacterized membrane protein YdjX (TVP38/TMEM64 family)